MTNVPLLIAGPTASGKSAYAMMRAREMPSVIVNADSMQVYRELRVVTARPSVEDETLVPHLLYGHVPAREAYSVGRYVSDVAEVLARAQAEGLRPVIVGGTGLYFLALLDGLSPVPPIPDKVRAHWRAEAERLGPVELHAVLAARDRMMAEKLRPSDPQRVTRALEVLEATGASLAVWQQTAGTPVLAADACEKVVILPERQAVFARADQRFDAMMEGGALEEVAALGALGLDPALPSMRALGVPQLLRLQRAEMAREAAIAEAKAETRRYIKRQLSWLKRNMISWDSIIL
ncbi:MAG: tRNA (adenosine(37)-N6)-dimethylallyltransferase MiaA [Hyphomicrobiaceae bacterium]